MCRVPCDRFTSNFESLNKALKTVTDKKKSIDAKVSSSAANRLDSPPVAQCFSRSACRKTHTMVLTRWCTMVDPSATPGLPLTGLL